MSLVRSSLLASSALLVVLLAPPVGAQEPERPARELVVVLDSGLAFGGWSAFGAVVEDEWPKLTKALATAIEDRKITSRDGSLSIAVVQGTGGALSGTSRDWLSGPTALPPFGIPMRTIENAADAAVLARDIRELERFSSTFGDCEPSVESTCLPFEQFLPGVSLDVAVDQLSPANDQVEQTVCLVGDVDSGGGWFGFFETNPGPTPPSSRRVDDAFVDGFLGTERVLRIVDLPSFFGLSAAFPVSSRDWYENLKLSGQPVYYFESSGVTDLLSRVRSCFGQVAEFVGLEITQGVQRLRETPGEEFIELYREKPTTVRAYFQQPGEEEPSAHSPILRAFVNGRELDESPLHVENYKAPPKIRREDTASSANFGLPLEWTALPKIDLVVENIASECPEACEATVTFAPSIQATSYQLLPVEWTDSDGVPHLTSASDLNRAELQIGAFIPDGLPPNVTRGPVLRGVTASGAFLNKGDFSRLLLAINTLSYLRTTLAASWCTEEETPLSICGTLSDFVSAAILSDFPELGPGEPAARGLWNAQSIAAYRDLPRPLGPWPYRVVEHELGHLFGLVHAPGAEDGGPEPADASFPDPRYIRRGRTYQFNPSLPERVRALAWDTTLGITAGKEPGAVAGAAPASALYEVMTYMRFVWISDINYAKARENLVERAQQGFDEDDFLPTGVSNRVFVVRFVLEGGTDAVTWNPFLTALTQGFLFRPDPEPGPYRIEFLFDDELVAETNVDVKPASFQGAASGSDGIGIVGVSLDEPVTEVVLYNADTEIGRLRGSASPPLVAEVNATVEPDSIVVEWTSADADGDDLRSTLLYRGDFGPWNPVAIDVSGDSYTFDRGELAGASVGQFRVIVSDGFYSAEAESAPVVVPGSPPTIGLLRPVGGAQISQAESLRLRALASDTEDGSLGDEALEWSSDADGRIGVGRDVPVMGTALTPGIRTISLTATDSDGNQTIESVEVEVLDVLTALSRTAPDARITASIEEDWLLADSTVTVPLIVQNVGNSSSAAATVAIDANAGLELQGVGGDAWSCSVASPFSATCEYGFPLDPRSSAPLLDVTIRTAALEPTEDIGVAALRASVEVAEDSDTSDNVTGLVLSLVDEPPPAQPVQVEARVVDEATGTPLEDAIVTLRSGPASAVSGTADVAGVVILTDVVPGEWVVDVDAPGFPSAVFQLDVPAGGDLVVTLPVSRDVRPASFEGVVVATDDGSPVTTAEVVLATLEGSEVSATVDSSGAFAFNALPPGSYQLTVVGTGYESFATAISLEPGGSVVVEVPLQPEQTDDILISGMVVDAGTGQPIAGSTVRVEAPGSFAESQTDGAGTFSVTLDQSKFGLDRVAAAVTFGGPGYRALATEVVLVSGATNLVNASLAREAPTTITGRVSDSRTSRSLVDARASLVTDTEIGSALSDATGTYRIELDPNEPAPASASLVVELDGYETSTTQVSMSTGSTTLASVALVSERPVNVNLAPSVSGPSDLSVGQQGRFHVQLFNIGSVQLPSGSPVEVTVLVPPFLTVVSTSGSSWSCQAATGGLGCVYNRRINPGSLSNELEIVASPLEGSVDQLGELTVLVDPAVGPTRSSDSHLVRALAAANPDFTLFLEPANRLIVPGASVSFQVVVASIDGWTEPVGLVTEGLPPGYTATINPAVVVPNGTALLTIKAPNDAAPGPVSIDIVGLSNAIERRTSAAVELEFGLIPVCTGTVSGVVTDARTNQPVVGMTVKIGPSSVPTDANGIFRLNGVPVGSSNQPRTYIVESPTTLDYWSRVTPGVVVACDTETVANFAVLPRDYAVITGRVVEGVPNIADPSRFRTVRPTTTPIEGAIVSLTIPSRFVSGGTQESVTNSQGEFRFGRAPVDPAGPTRLRVLESGYWPETRSLYLSDGGEADLTIPLVYSCDGSARVRAVDAETGVPLPNIRLRMFTANPPYPSKWTDATGSAFFDELELGQRNSVRSYQVVVTGHELGPYDEISVTAPPTWVEVPSCGATGQADIPVTIVETPRPPDRVQVLGSIIDAQTGEPIPFTGMTFRREGETFGESFDTAMDGTFVAELLPGRYFTSSGSFGFEPAFGEVEVVEPGPVTAQLALEPNLGFVAGTVVDTLTGEPVPNASIQRPGWTLASAESDGSYVYPVVLRRDSTSEPFEVLEDLELSVRATGYYNGIVEGIGPVRVGETLQRDLPLFPIPDCAPATIRGRVVNAETREPIEDADVGASGQEPVQTDVDGRFEFLADVSEIFRVGSLRVTAEKVGFVSAAKNVTVWCGAIVSVDFGEPATSTTTISGFVTRADTMEPVEGAFVGAEFGLGATTLADGSYLIEGAPLGPGDGPREWILSVDPPGPSGLEGTSTTVVVSADTEAWVDFVLTVLGVDDQCPEDPNKVEPGFCGCGVPDVDLDEDGIIDCEDSCVDALDPDNDGDGIGDLCDPDDDNDGVSDGVDNCPLTANSAQLDNDLDGWGDVCDADDDDDGVDDVADNCPFDANPDQVDTDGDGAGDVCDPDDPPVCDPAVLSFDRRDVDRNEPSGDNGKEFVADLDLDGDGGVDDTEIVGLKTAGGGRVQDTTNGNGVGFVDVRGFKTRSGFTGTIAVNDPVDLADMVHEGFRFNGGRFGIDKSGQRKNEGFPGDEGETSGAKDLNADELLLFDLRGLVVSGVSLDVLLSSRDDDGIEVSGRILALEGDGDEFTVAQEASFNGNGEIDVPIGPARAFGVVLDPGQVGRVGVSLGTSLCGE